MDVQQAVIELRKKGLSFDKIAKILKISKRDAYKHGKDVQVVAKRKEKAKIEPKTPKKEAFTKDLAKADSRVFIKGLVWEVAELLGCGKKGKDKFDYDMSKPFCLKCKEYEKTINKTKGFIPPAQQHILNFCFERCRTMIENARKENAKQKEEFEEEKEVFEEKIGELNKEIEDWKFFRTAINGFVKKQRLKHASFIKELKLLIENFRY